MIRAVDAVVFEHGVVPNDQPYVSLRDTSSNGGVVDFGALTSCTPQPTSDEGFIPFRIGDAVASRGIAAAMYGARRLCQLL